MVASIPSHFQLDTRPVADPAAVVQVGLARITVLAGRLLRLEYAPDGQFEDRASQAFWYRDQAPPPFTTETNAAVLTLTTDHLQLVYNGGPFDPDNLEITLTGSGTVWRPGQDAGGNLLGTYRTLDEVSGSTPLEPGLLSRDGWTVVDDSDRLVFDDQGWLQARSAAAGYQDLYFFGFGHDYRAALGAYGRVSGRPPLLPRWALGNWWSRYWEYTQAELTALMRDFRAHEIPLSVCIVDMDWHLTDTGGRGDGWTGYTWNRELFPDPAAFVAWLHDQGLRTALNLHPALGVRAHESQYAAVAERLGIDPATEAPIPFDLADPTFARAYFELLHHPEETETGVDFWWIDWQQGTETKISGLDPLWWLNHLHFYDLGRDGVRRPFIFSRWGGLGNQRYPIGFSGDTIVNWDSLAFQPYFTATAANVAYGWWSHDIGGHMFGREEAELYRRWVQYGVFSPVLRLHSTNNPFHERRPWGYDAETFEITRQALQLRHALIPYLYTYSWRFAQTGIPPIRPLYHDYPEREEAYHCPGQYTFGDELLAAPFARPADPDTRLSRQVVWLPPGDWYDFFRGERYAGDAWHAIYGGPADTPVFAPAGAIVPLAAGGTWGGVDNPAALALHCFAGRSGTFTLYEDDGATTAYQQGVRAETTFQQTWADDSLTVTIDAARGDQAVLPPARAYTFHIYGAAEPATVALTVGGQPQPVRPVFDPDRGCLTIAGLNLAPDQALVLRLELRDGVSSPAPDNRLARAGRALAAFHLDTAAKTALAAALPELLAAPADLVRYAVGLSNSQRQALLEILTGSGVAEILNCDVPRRFVLWNNENRPDVRYHFAQNNEGEWTPAERFSAVAGPVPRFEAITLDSRPGSRLNWELLVDFLGVTQVRHQGSWQ